MVLNEPVYAVIRVDKLNPGDGLRLSNHIKTAGRRFVVIYDPSSIEAYYKPEAMQGVDHGNKSDENITLRKLIESVKTTLKELIEVRNAWVVIILPRELYEQVQRGKEEDVDLRQVLDNLERDVVTVDLRNEVFLREIIKRYSRCDNVSDDLVKGVMDFDSYTLVAKYAGIWLHEKECKVEDVEKALRESADKPKLFFAHYIWGVIFGKSVDLAMKASVPLILHATFGPIPEGITYITKAVNEGGVWKLIDKDKLAKSKLEDLREDDLEPIAKWLSTRHEDLIEETLQELVGLRGEEARKHYIDHGFENLIKTLNRSYHEKALEEVRGLSREVKPEEVESNLLIFVGERLKHALKPYTDCWKRAAFIIGAALAWDDSVPRPEDLPESLNRCGVDDYLLVGNVIPPLIRYLIYTRVLSEAFVDKYNEAVAEVNRILNIARGRDISDDVSATEVLYSLGLASIIAKAVESGKPIEPSDVDAALHIVSLTMQHIILSLLLLLFSTSRIKPILIALEPLRDKAPQRYLEVLVSALDRVSRPSIPGFILGFGCPDLNTVMYILNEFDYILNKLNKYRDGVKGRAWTLVHAIGASINSLYGCLKHCDDYSDAPFRTELERIASWVAGLLNEIDRLNPSLGIIAWAHALLPALKNKCVRALMESVLGVDVVNKKAKEVAEDLSRLRESAQELIKQIRDEDFMDLILKETSDIMYEWALYKLDNDELYDAKELFKGAAEKSREIGDYGRYLHYSNWALRAKAIRSKLAGDKLVELVDGFRQLYEQAKKQPDILFLLLSDVNDILDDIFGGYLVSLALTGGDEEIRRIEELLREEWRGPRRHLLKPILTRLTLNALLSPRGELSGELKDRLFVKPGEFILAFGWGYIDFDSLPALRAIYGTIRRGDEKRLCDESIDDLLQDLCMHQVSSVIDYSEKLDQRGEGNLRQGLINYFQRWISKGEVMDLLKKLGLDAELLKNELEGLIHELSGKSLPELAMSCSKREQRRCSSAHLAYMLYALINGNEKLAKAHALYGAISSSSKSLRRLFLEAYKECCDLKNESFRRAIARLFFYNV
jgi:hypothetical protein